MSSNENQERTAHSRGRCVERPRYDRRALRPTVAHIGVGSFHRAHQAQYLHELADAGNKDAGVVGVSMRSENLRQKLTKQDLQYSVVERADGAERVRVVGALSQFLYLPKQPQQVMKHLTSRHTKLVTLTITANGYLLDRDQQLAVSHPDVQASLRDPDKQFCAPGLLARALAARRSAGLPP